MLAAHGLIVARVSRDESFCSAGYGHFEEGKVVRVGKLEGQGFRENRLTTSVYTVEHRTDIFRGKGESRPRENGSVLGENSIVVKRHQVALEQQAQHLGWRAVRREES